MRPHRYNVDCVFKNKGYNMSWQLHKFGGTSLANADCYKNVKNILDGSRGQNAVVVSAMAGITNLLDEAVLNAKNQSDNYQSIIDEIAEKHIDCVDKLFFQTGDALKQEIQRDCVKISEILKAIFISKSASKEYSDLIQGHGEIWSAKILTKLMGEDALFVDARDILVISHGETGPEIDWQVSEKKLTFKNQDRSNVIITGFIASLANGLPTTLGRDGSDFSGSIFSNLLDAKLLTIWTDVDGIYSADPRRVDEARCIESLSYQEALELAYFGASIVHPHTMGPAIRKNIPIRIRNSFNQNAKGTIIEPTGQTNGSPIKGFSTVDNIALVNVEGTGMIGVPGIASRVFSSLREVGVSVTLISQASSEHSICFAVPHEQASLAKDALEKSLFSELHHNKIQRITIEQNCSIVAAVGNNMVHSIGVAADFFKSLSDAGVNIKAIAQGSSERNISAVVSREHSTKALQAVHSAFYLSNHIISIAIIGPGLIGKTLLNQLLSQRQHLKDSYNIELNIRGIANSKKMLTGASIGPDWEKDLNQSEKASDLDALVKFVKSGKSPHSIIIDCTASDYIGEQYLKWMEEGVHIITPNKKANSGDLKYYNQIKSKKSIQYLYEATVGAGLPIISTLRDLIQTGDKIESVEGIFSGTLSYIFNSFSEETHFSEIVQTAKTNGFTEPDPRDDLSGTDVARKVVILAREMGLEINIDDVEVESLVPQELRKEKNVDDFMKKLSKYDNQMNDKLIEASKNNQVLRFVGSIDSDGQCSASLKAFDTSHPFAGTRGSDNVIAFQTKRYKTRPLVVQGPGAGPEVTATGVFSDLLRLIENFGVKR